MAFPVKPQKVVFINYHGKGYGDSLKYICNVLLSQEEQNLDIVWIVRKELTTQIESIPKGIRIAYYNSFSGIYEMSTAKVWVANCRKLFCAFKKKNQYYIQTWHACMTLKLVEGDAFDKLDRRYRYCAIRDTRYCDLMISNSDVCTKMYRRAFWYKGEILECGCPRNDILVNPPRGLRESLRNHLGIKADEAVVMYAPTFRATKGIDPYIHSFSVLDESLERMIREVYTQFASIKYLVRLHPNMSENNFFIKESDVIDASAYPDMQELMLIADIVITDYSSTSIEFSMQRRPVFLYMPDIELYQKERGLFFQTSELPYSVAVNLEDLARNIREFNWNDYLTRLDDFLSRNGVQEYGTASRAVADRIITVCK